MADTEDIAVFVRFNGNWTSDYTYVSFSVIGALIPRFSGFSSFKDAVMNSLMLDETNSNLKIEYQPSEGFPPVEINNDLSVRFYIRLKAQSMVVTDYPLCVTMFSSVSSEVEGSIVDTSSNCLVPFVDEGVLSYPCDSATAEEFIDDHSLYISNMSDKAIDDLYSLGVVDYGNTSSNAMISVPKVTSLCVGQVFKDKSILKDALSYYALKNKFQFKVNKSCPEQFWLICVDGSCSWFFKASKRQSSSCFVVRKYCDLHTCDIDTKNGEARQATTNFVAKYIKKTLVNFKRVYRPLEIVDDVKDALKADINYQKAWRAKEEALKMLRGSASDSYSSLPCLLHMLRETNPGSVINLKMDGSHFKYLFIAFSASIQGWKYCRPVVVVDATFLTTCFRGALLTASVHDAAEMIFPIAFAVVDGENDESWGWFFTQMKEAFGERPDMVVVSDRHKSIGKTCLSVFPDASHCICSYHLFQNVRVEYRVRTKALYTHFFGACKSYNQTDFKEHMEQLGKIRKGIPGYLTKAGVEKWTRLYAPRKRYFIVTSNAAEAVNSLLKDGKSLPIASFVDFLRTTMQKLFYKNRNIAMNTFSVLSQRYEKELQDRFELASTMRVNPSTSRLVSVTSEGQEFSVDLDKRICTCNMFQMDELPCPHALAHIKKFHLVTYDYCSDYYKKETMLATYAGTIHPLPSKDNWIFPDDIVNQVVLPPAVKPKVGRPKLGRYRSAWEKANTTSIRCSICRKVGHNKKSCTGPK